MARDQVIKVVLATPPELLTTASPQERERVNSMLKNTLPVSVRADGLRSDVAVGKHLAPSCMIPDSRDVILSAEEEKALWQL